MNEAERKKQGGSSEHKGKSLGEDFFIPDLCNTQAVFSLVVASQLFALIVVVVAHPLPNFDWVSLGMTTLLTQWITLTCAAVICNIRPVLKWVPQRFAIAIALLIILLDTATFSLAGQWILRPQMVGMSFSQHIDYWQILRNLFISAIISTMVFRYFVSQYRLRLQEGAELNARLQSLQSRIRPHFLFNSMNIIASLIATDPKTAESVVEDLAELFRASLKETANAVPLAQEINLCKKYLRIEQLRIGKRLKVVWRQAKLPDDIEIPMLLLQPLLENAIYHGVQPLPEGGTVKIELSTKADMFRVAVTNPLPTGNGGKSDVKGNQMAIENIRNRLSAIYGAKGTLTNVKGEGDFTTVLSFPHNSKAR